MVLVFCSFYVDSIKCGEEFLETVDCIRPHLAQMMEQFRAGTGTLTEFFCGDYNEQTDACDRLGPVPKQGKVNNKFYATPVSLLVDLLDSFQNFTSPKP